MNQSPHDRFAAAYERLAEQGRCDGYGGTESKRVWREWIAALMPEPIDQFIIARANVDADGNSPLAARN